jgi:uncharacterized membrane protein (DUF4010 family)
MPELLTALLVSASLGALLGLERQWSSEQGKTKVDTIAGARTFALWAALGTICAWFDAVNHTGFFLTGFGGMVIFLSLLLYRRAKQDRDLGLTTGAVGLATYLLGGLVYFGQTKTAVVLTFLMVVLLASKEWLHALSRKFSRTDVYQALQFAAVTGIVLPLVPDQPFGPYGALNPWMIWLMVVLVSGLGFVGYVAVRIFGEDRGIPLTGLLGGLASSTATTLAMSRQSRAWPETGRLCALAIVLACTVMLARVAVLVGAISPSTLVPLAPWLAFIALPGVFFALWSWRHLAPRSPTGEQPAREVRNPLSLRIAIQFAILYALIVLLVRWADAGFGGAGVYWASFFSGLTDLDAISLSLAQLQRDGNLGPADAARAVLIAAGANSLLKGAMAVALGGRSLRGPVVIVLGTTVVLSAVAAWLV